MTFSGLCLSGPESDARIHVPQYDDSFSMHMLLDWRGSEVPSLDDTVVLRRDVLLRLLQTQAARADNGLPRHQDLRRRSPDLFTTLKGVKDLRAVAFVSHRWLSPRHPDPEGAQLRQLGAVLAARPALLYVFFDFYCLPQPAADGRDDRTPAEAAFFKRSLLSVKWLCAQASLVPLWAEGFTSRAWCFCELMWGHDNLITVPDVNEPDVQARQEVALVYRAVLTKAVYAPDCTPRASPRSCVPTFLAFQYVSRSRCD